MAQHLFRDGDQAVLRGLSKRSDLNGQRVSLVTWVPERCRWICRNELGRTFNIMLCHLFPLPEEPEEPIALDEAEPAAAKEADAGSASAGPQAQPPRARQLAQGPEAGAERCSEQAREPPTLGASMRTFVINLKRRPDRRASIEDLCRKLELDYEIVEACDGRALAKQPGARFEQFCSQRGGRKAPKPRPPLPPRYAKPKGFQGLRVCRWRCHFQREGRACTQLLQMAHHRLKASKLTPPGHELWGAVGCSISHQMVLEKIVADESIEEALILEDDCVLGLDSAEVQRVFNTEMRKVSRDYPDWQLVYLGGCISSNFRKREIEEWRISEWLLAARQVYQTHAFVIRRSLAQRILAKLAWGFAADAAFVSWSRSAGKKCFMFHPKQLLVQPGGEARWKDSDIFVEGEFFKHAAVERGGSYDFASAGELRKSLRRTKVDRQDLLSEEDFPVSAPDPAPRPRTKRRPPKRKAGAEAAEAAEAAEVAKPKPKPKPKAAPVDPVPDPVDPDPEVTDQLHPDPTREATSDSGDSELEVFRRISQDPNFGRALQLWGQPKARLMKLLKRGDQAALESFMKLLAELRECALGAHRLRRAALTAAISAAVEAGFLGRLRCTVQALSLGVEVAPVFRQKVAALLRCALEFHVGLPKAEVEAWEQLVLEQSQELQQRLPELEELLGHERYHLDLRLETSILPELLSASQAASAQFRAVKRVSREMASRAAKPSPPSPGFQAPKGTAAPARAKAAAEAAKPAGGEGRARFGSKAPAKPAAAQREGLPRPAPEPPARKRKRDATPGSEKIPRSRGAKSKKGPKTDPPVREPREKLLAMSVGQLRAKAKFYGVPHGVFMACLEKTDLVQALLDL